MRHSAPGILRRSLSRALSLFEHETGAADSFFGFTELRSTRAAAGASGPFAGPGRSNHQYREGQGWASGSGAFGGSVGLVYRAGNRFVSFTTLSIVTRGGGTQTEAPRGSGLMPTPFTNRLLYLRGTFPLVVAIPLGTEERTLDVGAGLFVGTLLNARTRVDTSGAEGSFRRMTMGSNNGADIGRVDYVVRSCTPA